MFCELHVLLCFVRVVKFTRAENDRTWKVTICNIWVAELLIAANLGHQSHGTSMDKTVLGQVLLHYLHLDRH